MKQTQADNAFVLEALEVACEQCAGRGIIDVGSNHVDCYECDGKGYLLTEAGTRFLQFLERHTYAMRGPRRVA